MSSSTLPHLEPGVLATIISFNHIANYTTVMAATLVSYDWIITLDQEVGNNNDNLYPWISLSHTQYKILGHFHIFAARNKWTLPNCLCIVARYLGLAFILFFMSTVSMSSVRGVNLDFFASVATQRYSFMRLLAFLLFTLTEPTAQDAYQLDSTLGLFIIQLLSPGIYLILIFFTIFINWRLLGVHHISYYHTLEQHCPPRRGVCWGRIPSYVPLLYQITLRRTSLGIKALP
ncbi:hypothetical protein BU17DRAFT_68730 [Hysterangium stoloniferum]|nr:hypothetical protein BU17DRAFT_68730 [Hysterangium stoloniferum]